MTHKVRIDRKALGGWPCPAERRPWDIWMGAPPRRDARHPEGEGHSASPDQGALEILLVDDDPLLLESLADLIDLRFPHARVTTCLSGAVALELAGRQNFHAIITDVKMPGMTGLMFMTELQRRRPMTPVIVITGHGDLASRSRAMELGASAFLQKPLNRDVFVASLRQALGRQQSGGPGAA